MTLNHTDLQPDPKSGCTVFKSARPIPEFPDYAITQNGEVYRVTPYTGPIAGRYGDTPRLLKPSMRGGWVQHRQPSVTLISSDGRQCQRLVRKLVREIWGEVR